MLSELRDESAKMATAPLGRDQTKFYRENKILDLDLVITLRILLFFEVCFKFCDLWYCFRT